MAEPSSFGSSQDSIYPILSGARVPASSCLYGSAETISTFNKSSFSQLSEATTAM